MESESSFRHTDNVACWDTVVGLGANVGRPELALRRAVIELSAAARHATVSKLYRSEPVGGPSQPDFLNAALRVLWPAPPRLLLERLHTLELGAGRERLERWGPRTLDLDILWVAGLELREPDLVIPHPRLRQRAFALRPLLDVAPHAVDPVDGVPYAQALAELGSAGVVAVTGGWVELSEQPSPRAMDRPAPGW
ncbi:MAG: 2-amino-4-hydroxy-6-hydroxymethyldihydropteridine diphosphokinase [Deltaproteobacteria bacterium]